MADIVLTVQSEPPTPSAGTVTVYIDIDTAKICFKTSDGVVHVVNST